MFHRQAVRQAAAGKGADEIAGRLPAVAVQGGADPGLIAAVAANQRQDLRRTVLRIGFPRPSLIGFRDRLLDRALGTPRGSPSMARQVSTTAAWAPLRRMIRPTRVSQSSLKGYSARSGSVGSERIRSGRMPPARVEPNASSDWAM